MWMGELICVCFWERVSILIGESSYLVSESAGRWVCPMPYCRGLQTATLTSLTLYQVIHVITGVALEEKEGKNQNLNIGMVGKRKTDMAK